jgi:hypothetical protein
MAMGYFVDLTLAWYGGESEMLRHVGEGKMINFRVRPCCFCFICPKATPFNRKKIRLFRGAVYQVTCTYVRMRNKGSILQNIVSAENLLDKFSSSIFGQIFAQNQHILNC